MAYMILSEKPRSFVDCETTGLDDRLNEILEFACLKVHKDGREETLVLKIKPRRIHTAHPKALEVNGYNEPEWVNAIDGQQAAIQIAQFLKDTVIIGHNVRFDIGFIQQLLKEFQVSVRLDYHLVDTIAIAYLFLVPQGLESVNLANVCKFLCIPPEPSQHRALAGVLSCKAVYDELTSRIARDELVPRQSL